MPNTDALTRSSLDHMDGRLTAVKEVKAKYWELINSIGGLPSTSYLQRSLCVRAVWLEKIISSHEQAMSGGDGTNSGNWVQATNALIGIYRCLGLSEEDSQ